MSGSGFHSVETLASIEESHAAWLAGNHDQYRALSSVLEPSIGEVGNVMSGVFVEDVEGHLNADAFWPACLKKLYSW